MKYPAQPKVKGGVLTSRQANRLVRDHLRSKPYTETGLARQKCVHCGAPAKHQWHLRPCAIGRIGWYPLCRACDIEMNRAVMAFLKLPDADERLAVYQERMAA